MTCHSHFHFSQRSLIFLSSFLLQHTKVFSIKKAFRLCDFSLCSSEGPRLQLLGYYSVQMCNTVPLKL